MENKKIFCSRCGKELFGNMYLLVESDTFNGRTESYWCEDCYNSFMKELGEIEYEENN